MEKSIELKIGGDRFGLPLPDEADILMIREPQKRVTRQGFTADLKVALPSKSLHGGRVAVVLADKTRLCGYDRYLPILLNVIEERGASKETLSARCRSGRLNGNPLAEDLAEIEGCRPADVAIHGILDSHGTVCRLMVGSGIDHFRRACEYHGQNCEIEAGDGYDMVVASCGGYPKDINFIQAHKAIHHAAAFAKDGGGLIVFAQCRD